MGINAHSALSIYCNPYDLCFFVGESGGMHNAYVSFGPNREYRPIVTTRAVFTSKEDAVAGIGKLLDLCIKVGDIERTGGDGTQQVTGIILGAEGLHMDEALRDRILADLRSDRHQADTFEYEHAA